MQYSPLVEVEEGAPLSEQEVSLSAPCRDVLRSLPASAAEALHLKDLRHAAMHGSLRPVVFGPLSDEQLLELVKFLDFWELPLPWLRMALAERGARLHPPTLPAEGAERPPLDAYSDAAATWALVFEIEPLLLSVAHSLSAAPSKEPRLCWSALQLEKPTATACALHILCGARQPELVLPDDKGALSCVLARAGDIEALRWAREHGCPWAVPGPWPYDQTTCAEAAREGHLGVLQWLHESGCPWDDRTSTCAAAGGHVEVLQWLWEHGCPLAVWACSQAAERGHLEVLQWARGHGCRWNAYTCSRAAKGGHLEILQWAREQGCPWDSSTCTNAARNGHLEVLQWAREHGAPWDEYTCSRAATGGHLFVLQWLREQGCPWDEETCYGAAGRGHLIVMQWLHEHGAPWDKQACREAAGGGHLEVLQWLRAHGSPWDKNNVRLVAQCHQQQAIVQWLDSEESGA